MISLKKSHKFSAVTFWALVAAYPFLANWAFSSTTQSPLTVGLEITAVTPLNDSFDISKPVNGAKIDFVRLAAERFAELSGTKASKVKGTSIMTMWHGGYDIPTAAGVWKFHNDHGALEAVSPVLGLDHLEDVANIYHAFEDVGLSPNVGWGGQNMGGGHIHLGIKTFRENPLLLRNLLVEFVNRPYLQAVFEEWIDDQSWRMIDRPEFKSFKRAIEDWDRHWYAGEKMTVESLIDAYFEGMMGRTPAETNRFIPEFLRPVFWRNIDVRVSDVNMVNPVSGGPPTAEFRFFRQAETAETLVKRVEFMDHLVKYLDSSFSEPIAIHQFTKEQLAILRKPEVASSIFSKYVTSKLKMPASDFTNELNFRFPELVTIIGELEQAQTKVMIKPSFNARGRGFYEVELHREGGLRVSEGLVDSQSKRVEAFVELPGKRKPQKLEFIRLKDNVYTASFQGDDLSSFRLKFTQNGEIVDSLSGVFELALNPGEFTRLDVAAKLRRPSIVVASEGIFAKLLRWGKKLR